MKASPAALWIGIGGAALVAGLVWLLWPTEAGTRNPSTSGEERAVEPRARPTIQPESREPGPTIAPRPFDADQVPSGGAEAVDASEPAISGEVVDFDGSRPGRVVVALFAMRDGAPHAQADERTVTDDQGRFRIRVGSTEAAKVALVASAQRRRPATVVVARDTREPVRLVLGEGAAIEGTVSIDGAAVGSASVDADIRPGVDGPSSISDEFWWSGSAFETKQVQVGCDDGGRFSITGLAEDTYQIQVNPMTLGPVERAQVGMIWKAEVRAPAKGVELSLKTGLLSVKVTGKGRALESARIAVREPNGGRTVGPSGMAFVVRVASGLSLTVEAAHVNFEPATLPVQALHPGEKRELTVTLVESTGPKLELTLRGAGAMKLERVHVRFFPMAPAPENENRAFQDVRRGLVAVRAGGDEFVVDHLPHPPGPAIVVIGAGHPGWLVPIQQDVSVPAAGVLEIADEAIAGGHLGVSAVDPSGFPVAGRVTVRDARGKEVWKGGTQGWGGGFGPGLPYDARREALEFARNLEVLPPGSYEIEVTPVASEYESAKRTVTIRANETTMPEVRLEQRAK